MDVIARNEADDLLVRRAGDGVSLVVERGDGDPVRVLKGEIHRYVPVSQHAGAVGALEQVRLYGEKMLRDRNEQIRRCGADLLGLLE